MNTNIGICGYPEEEMASMTVEEALQQADKLKEQGCITTTAKALLALASAYRVQKALEYAKSPEAQKARTEGYDGTY